jgi:hypothetical protein
VSDATAETAGTEQGTEQAEQQQTGGFDPAALTAQMQQMQQSFEQRLDALTPEAEAEDPDAWLNDLAGDDELARQDAQRQAQVAKQIAEQQMQPYLQRLEQDRLQREAQQVVSELPDLASEEHAVPAVQAARAFEQDFGGRFDGLSEEPRFVAAMHKAAMFDRMVAEQQRQEVPGTALEGGGGTQGGGGGQSQEQLLNDLFGTFPDASQVFH